MGSRVQFFLAVVLFLGNPWSNGCSPPIVCGAPSWEERFQTEAPQSWDKYRDRQDDFRDRFRLQRYCCRPGKLRLECGLSLSNATVVL